MELTLNPLKHLMDGLLKRLAHSFAFHVRVEEVAKGRNHGTDNPVRGMSNQSYEGADQRICRGKFHNWRNSYFGRTTFDVTVDFEWNPSAQSRET
jgi:hypothetical protein